MSSVLLLLQIEHRKMAKLLDVIEQQASNMARNDPVNYRLLESAFAYLSSYPDQCHHPKEDQVYRKLLSHHPEMAESLSDLVKEHETLAQAIRDTTHAVQESRQLRPSGDDGLASRLIEFLDLYRHHMLMENLHFFPAALKSLSQEDLAQIDFTLFDRPDPLLDQESEARFGELREEILKAGVAEQASSDQRNEAALLSTLQDLATFNAAMQRSKAAVRLARAAGEGYELLGNGRVLAHIPACSESRAAWCAYFYWKAASG